MSVSSKLGKYLEHMNKCVYTVHCTRIMFLLVKRKKAYLFGCCGTDLYKICQFVQEGHIFFVNKKKCTLEKIVFRMLFMLIFFIRNTFNVHEGNLSTNKSVDEYGFI